MGLLHRLSRLIRSNLNSLVSRAEDPEKLLEQAVEDMQSDLIQLRQAVAQAIATRKRSERQLAQSESIASDWQQRAKLALQQGHEDLAREALLRRKSYSETARSIQAQLQQQTTIIGKLKQSMAGLESKLAEAKTRKDLFIARARAAQASQQLNETLGRVNTNNALSVFGRMEERVHQLEAEAEATAELSGDDLEKQFAALESSSGVDQELAAMKKQLIAEDPAQLPESDPARPDRAEADRG